MADISRAYSDRRGFTRIIHEAPCLVYAEGQEYDGAICDICEDGVGIRLPHRESSFDALKGKDLKAVIVDDCTPYNIKLRIVWIKDDSEGYVKLGGRILNPDEVEKYVTNKRVSIFWKNSKR